jgi:hypothetical protein
MDTKQQFSAEKSSDEIDSASIGKGTTRGGLRAWAKKLSVETGGIERVTDEERLSNTTHVWNACTFWYDPSITRIISRKLMSAQVECQYGSRNTIHRHGWWQHGIILLGLLCDYPRGERCFLSPASLDGFIWFDWTADDYLLVRHGTLQILSRILIFADDTPSATGATSSL